MPKLEHHQPKHKLASSLHVSREYKAARQLIALDAAWPSIDACATELVSSGSIKSIADLMAHRPLNQLLRAFHRQLEHIDRELGCINRMQAGR